MSPEELRVAMLSEHASPLALLGGVDAGGQNVYVDEVSRHLAQLGCHIDVFTRRDDRDAAEVVPLAPGANVIHVDAGPPEFVPKDDLWPLMPTFRDGIMRHIKHRRLDYDIVHGNFWMSGWVGLEIARSLDRPLVQIFHATGVSKRRHQGEADTSPAERATVERDIVDGADHLIAQCPSEYWELVEDYGSTPFKITVIPSAVDAKLFRPLNKLAARRELGLSPDEVVIGYVGRMLPRKDVRNVLHGAALVGRHLNRPPKVMVVGGETREPDPAKTPELGELLRLAEDLGIQRSLWLCGKRQPGELATYYSAADVVVTTPWYEPFGLTPLEAMACGRPVIGSRVGGISFTVKDGETGLLVPPRDPEALSVALLRLLIDEPLRQSMGSAARRRVEKQFLWAGTALHTRDLYLTVRQERVKAAALAAAGARPEPPSSCAGAPGHGWRVGTSRVEPAEPSRMQSRWAPRLPAGAEPSGRSST